MLQLSNNWDTGPIPIETKYKQIEIPAINELKLFYYYFIYFIIILLLFIFILYLYL